VQRGRLRVMVRYTLVVLVEQGRLSQEEAAREMGLSYLRQKGGHSSCDTTAPRVRGPAHPIHPVSSRYAAYVNQVFALLGIQREHLDWRQHAA
jgi:hypothetical protein